MLKRIINAVRRNHALEHATVSVLLKRHGRETQIVGRAVADGFYIYGDVSTEKLEEFAQEGLVRLQRGESHLAVSPHCGTNLAVAGLLAGFASYLALSYRKNSVEALPNTLAAALLAVLVAKPLGNLAQKHFTTLADHEGIRIVSVERLGRGLASIHKVRTERLPRI